MEPLPVTTLVAAAFALLMVPLSLLVSLRRKQTDTVFGDAGDRTLRRRIRAHANFAEYAPLALAVVAVAEYRGAAATFVWVLGIGFILSRILHAIGMLYTSTPTVRAVGVLINHACFLAGGIWLAAAVVRSA